MLHRPTPAAGKDPAVKYKMRLGIWMFVLYSLFYAGFVLINLVNPLLMERTLFWELNLASIYGMALIIVALLEALVYDWLCRRQEQRMADAENDKES